MHTSSDTKKKVLPIRVEGYYTTHCLMCKENYYCSQVFVVYQYDQPLQL